MVRRSGPAHLDRWVLKTLVALVLVSTMGAQDSAQSAASRLRLLFFQRDYETGAIQGASQIAEHPNASNLKAWYVLSLVRSGYETAVAVAEEMTTSSPQNAWGWFALAGALDYAEERPEEALAAADRALTLLPRHPDVIWMRAQVLASDPKRRTEAISFVNRQRLHVKNPAELLVLKGIAQYLQASGTPRDVAGLKAAFATFAEARRIDSRNVSARYLAARYLNELRRSDEAYPIAKEALRLSPGSTAVHEAYWNAVTRSVEITPDRKREDLEADVGEFLRVHGNRPGALAAVARVSREMNQMDRALDCEEKILKEFPGSTEAEWILASRWRELPQSDKASLHSAEYRQLLRDFISRPKHHIKVLLGEAYMELFLALAADESSPSADLYQAAEGAVKYERMNLHFTHAIIPIELADRKTHLAEAESMARQGIDLLRKKVESQRSVYKTQGEYDRAMGWMTGMGHDALGWVLLAEGRSGEAEKELLTAYDLNHEDRRTLDHLGRLYVAKNDTSKAEEYFVRGFAVEGLGINPCETSLRSLYKESHGSLEGIDEYFAKLKDAERKRRRDSVLAERITNSETVPTFNLKAIGGKRITLEELKGKIVVINFWGIWCGPCVQELPEYQKLSEKYANDQDVVILTINNDAKPDDVPPWMTHKKFTFPVLIDDGYVEKSGLGTFPTTWFLDRRGRKVFEKVGWSEKLFEEFGWRIEALRGTTAFP